MRAASLGVLALALVTVSRAAAPQSAQAVRLPYVEADSRFVNVTDPNDPFADSYRSGARAGGDMKVDLAWQQNRSADRDWRTVRPGDLFDALGAPGDNFLALKASYWIPVR
ncbi:MAG TPA: hypothetical protein VFZ56_07230 [Gemmatimonadaceae bacterium]